MPRKTLPFSGGLLSMPSTLESTLRRSTRQKSNRAAMDNQYMIQVLMATLSTPDCQPEPSCQ